LAEGAYLFKNDPDHLYAIPYSNLDPDVTYEHGKYLDQWTIKFFNDTTKQAAMVKVRYSPRFDEIIEFDVQLSEIPLVDKHGKDVTMNWITYDDFDGNSTFWTDANGLEMQERKLHYKESFIWHKDR
jgi:hypothetical protein